MGLGHVDGMTVFVRNALPGEKVQARVEKVQKNCAFLKTLSVETPSRERREPRCPVYWQCGGCQTQHMSYALSLETKREHVRDVQERLGGIKLDVPTVIGMDDPWHYRNKISLPFGPGPSLGYYAPRSHRLIQVDNCPIAMSGSEQVFPIVLKWAKTNQIPVYDEASGKGLLRHLMIRQNRKEQMMVVLVAAGTKLPMDSLVDALKTLPGLHSVCLNINRQPGNAILGKETIVCYGPDRLRDRLCGLDFDLSPVSFFQVNPVQTEKLYSLALSYANLTGDETVCDLYCGAGTISLMLSRKCRQVIGVEEVEPAVRDAEHNARINGITNARFIAGKTEDVLPDLVENGLRPDVIVLDPPRKGCDVRVLDAIAKCAPDRIVYVACDPATQARDIKILCASGYQARQTQSVDMFCHTTHVETVCCLYHQKKDFISVPYEPKNVE